MRIVALMFALFAAVGVGPAVAQEQAWVQIEAHPDLSVAQGRAEAYAAVLPDVVGYQAASGWYLIALGPFEPAAAAARLSQLRRDNLIPDDSFISDGRVHRAAFWPQDGVQGLAPDTAIEQTAIADPAAAPEVMAVPEAAAAVPDPAAVPEAAVVPDLLPADETPQQARASEADLSRQDRMMLQTALQWFGFYTLGIDGDFGPGTRTSMAAWQVANGFEATGTLTTLQRATLVANQQADQAEFGFETVTDAEAGIEITLPLALVGFDRYEPPFVQFAGKTGSGVSVMLISQPGDEAAFAGLFDRVQSLGVMPPDGPRERGARSFTITGTSATAQGYAYAERASDQIKGYIVVWTAADAARMERILPVIKASFRSVGETALDPGLVMMDDSTRRGLLDGLDRPEPKFSRSGFFVDARGTVLTTAEAVAPCRRITIERDTDATVTLTDASGIAVLTPAVPLAPSAFATLATNPRIGSDIAVAGYGYEDILPAPVLSYGRLEAVTGPGDETGLARISAPVLPGDAGGPVLDAGGAVIGMLLPAMAGAGTLPDGVALVATDLARVALAAGVTLATGAGEANPDAQARAAQAMTVLVSCWE